MRHFNSQTGGRYTYTDDVINLQELALAINAIFDGCDNFIISGCEISGTTIAPGYVYINVEISYFYGASVINSYLNFYRNLKHSLRGMNLLLFYLNKLDIN